MDDSTEVARLVARAKKRFALGLEQRLERRSSKNEAGAQQTEEALVDLAVRFLHLHIRGEENLPRDVAMFVCRVLEDALAGHPAACLTHKAGGRNKSQEEDAAEGFAASCVKHAEAGRIDIRDPVKTIVGLFKVDPKTVRRWCKKTRPDILGQHLARLPPDADPTRYARETLEAFAALHLARRAKSD